jgi:hypothetical protein
MAILMFYPFLLHTELHMVINTIMYSLCVSYGWSIYENWKELGGPEVKEIGFLKDK